MSHAHPRVLGPSPPPACWTDAEPTPTRHGAAWSSPLGSPVSDRPPRLGTGPICCAASRLLFETSHSQAAPWTQKGTEIINWGGEVTRAGEWSETPWEKSTSPVPHVWPRLVVLEPGRGAARGDLLQAKRPSSTPRRSQRWSRSAHLSNRFLQKTGMQLLLLVLRLHPLKATGGSGRKKRVRRAAAKEDWKVIAGWAKAGAASRQVWIWPGSTTSAAIPAGNGFVLSIVAQVRGLLSGHIPWYPSSDTPELSTGWFALHASAISLLLPLDTMDFVSLTSASPARLALSTCSRSLVPSSGRCRNGTCSSEGRASAGKAWARNTGHPTIRRKKKMHASKEDQIGTSLE